MDGANAHCRAKGKGAIMHPTSAALVSVSKNCIFRFICRLVHVKELASESLSRYGTVSCFGGAVSLDEENYVV